MPVSIHDACNHGDLDAVRRLLAADPTAVDADDQHNWRPLFCAALHRHVAIVRALLAAGADVSAHDGYALHYAAEVPGNKEIVGLLITHGALEAHVRPSDALSRQFLAALFLAEEERVQALLARHPELATRRDGRGDDPLHHAARNGDTAIARLLIAHGADVNALTTEQHSVLYCAAGHGHVETVELLLASGVDANAPFSRQPTTILEWLAQYPQNPRFAAITAILQRHLND